MNDLLMYLLKSTLCMSAFYLVFRTLMRKLTFFQLNRLILLSIVGFSMIIPLVHLPQTIHPAMSYQLTRNVERTDLYQHETPGEVVSTENEVISQPMEATSTSPQVRISRLQVVQMIYLSGLLVSLLVSLIGFLRILFLFRKVLVIIKDGFRLMIVPNDIPAFSFGRYLFISKSDYETNGDTILTHEKAHVKYGHFYDLLLLEVVKIIYWFNPVIYWLIRDLKAIHEFQADDSTLNNGIDATQYQLLIIQKGVGSQRFALANSFNHCQIKNRIIMMNKQKTSKAWRWKVATFLPLLALLLVFCGRNGGNEPPANSFQFKDQSFSVDRCEIANESFDNTSKFEVDLLIGKKDNNLNDTTNEKNVIWFSIASKNVSDITEGEYHFSSKNVNNRAAMTFSGAVWMENKKMDIIEGDLMCKRDSGKINISFKLKVDKENELKGTYSGSFVYISTREKTLAQKIPVKEQMPEMKVDTNELVIRFIELGI